MDAASKFYICFGTVAIVAAFVAFWFISRKAPKGVLFVLGVALWLTGQVLAKEPARELKFIGGILTLTGFVGGLLGFLDLFRRRKAAAPPNNNGPDKQQRPPPPPVPQPRR